MNHIFTESQAENFLSSMKEEYDVVRLVDPVHRKVLHNLSSEGDNKDEICHMIWGRCERCENCTSLRALQNRESSYKLETVNHQTYWVHSRYMEIDEKPVVAEFVSNVTEKLIMDSNQRDQIGRLIQNYNRMLITDPLTLLYNRRFLDEDFIPSLKCCYDEHITVNLAFIDMDDFKLINDHYGHTAGDQTLKDVAGFWKLHFNSREKGKERIVVRFGGDEFLVIACGISAEKFADEIEKYSEEMRKICYLPDASQFTFTFTYGISSSEGMKSDWEWKDLVDAADQSMYESKKKKGQNC